MTFASVWSTSANVQSKWNLCWHSCSAPALTETWGPLHQSRRERYLLQHNRWTPIATWASEPGELWTTTSARDHDSRRMNRCLNACLSFSSLINVYCMSKSNTPNLCVCQAIDFSNFCLLSACMGRSNRFPHGAIQTSMFQFSLA
jgi:hypothetical protein